MNGMVLWNQHPVDQEQQQQHRHTKYFHNPMQSVEDCVMHFLFSKGKQFLFLKNLFLSFNLMLYHTKYILFIKKEDSKPGLLICIKTCIAVLS